MIFPPLVELCADLKAQGHFITIETAGTSWLDVQCNLISLSPKLAHSNPGDEWSDRHESRRKSYDVMQRLCNQFAAQLKFVVRGEHISQDLQEIDEILEQIKAPSSVPILLMPEGINAQSLMESAQNLVPICIERQWRLATRLHIDLFGNTKGT